MEDGYPGTKVFSAIASNYPNAGNYKKDNHPKDYEWFMLNIWPAGNALKNAGIQQYADAEDHFTINGGLASFYEILKAKTGTEDMVLPVYSGFASNNSYEVVLQQGTNGFPAANVTLKNAMISLLKSVYFKFTK